MCREVVKEITDAVLKEDPKKTVQVGGFRIQPDGSQKQSQVIFSINFSGYINCHLFLL